MRRLKVIVIVIVLCVDVPLVLLIWRYGSKGE